MSLSRAQAIYVGLSVENFKISVLFSLLLGHRKTNKYRITITELTDVILRWRCMTFWLKLVRFDLLGNILRGIYAVDFCELKTYNISGLLSIVVWYLLFNCFKIRRTVSSGTFKCLACEIIKVSKAEQYILFRLAKTEKKIIWLCVYLTYIEISLVIVWCNFRLHMQPFDVKYFTPTNIFRSLCRRKILQTFLLVKTFGSLKTLWSVKS